MKKISWIHLLISVSFLFLTVWFSISNFQVISGSISDLLENRCTLREFIENITADFKSADLFHKDDLITLNGLYGRLSGRRYYNNIILLNNGMLTGDDISLKQNQEGIDIRTTSILSFKNYISELGGYFLFVQLPSKYDMKNELMPQGYSSQIPQDTEILMNAFEYSGIELIDMLPDLSQTGEDIETNFYRTDHHWKPTAAFKTFQRIIQHLQKIYPEENYGTFITDQNNWTVHEIPNQFLGSRGKRVGQLFSGMDSLEWLTPNFETNLYFYIPHLNSFYSGSYEHVFIRDEYTKPDNEKLHKNHYVIHVGEDYPLTISRNMNSLSEQKLLLIKDSFDLPLLTYLSLIFHDVHVIDPRHYKSSSIYDYVAQFKPDIVIMAITSTSLTDYEYFHLSNGENPFLHD